MIQTMIPLSIPIFPPFGNVPPNWFACAVAQIRADFERSGNSRTQWSRQRKTITFIPVADG